jgi:hypothetical protein
VTLKAQLSRPRAGEYQLARSLKRGGASTAGGGLCAFPYIKSSWRGHCRSRGWLIVPPNSESRRQRNHEPPKSGIQKRKKTAMNIGLSCKIEYLFRSNRRDQSMTSEYFTGDQLRYRSCMRTVVDGQAIFHGLREYMSLFRPARWPSRPSARKPIFSKRRQDAPFSGRHSAMIRRSAYARLMASTMAETASVPKPCP